MNAQPKKRRVTDRRYIWWIKTQVCIVRRLPRMEAEECVGPIDPHHSTPVSLGGSDYTAVPLCRKHHDELQSSMSARPWMVDKAGELVKEYRKLPPPPPSRTRKQGVSLKSHVVNCDCWRKKHTIPKSKGEITGRCLVFTCPTTSERKEARI